MRAIGAMGWLVLGTVLTGCPKDYDSQLERAKEAKCRLEDANRRLSEWPGNAGLAGKIKRLQNDIENAKMQSGRGDELQAELDAYECP